MGNFGKQSWREKQLAKLLQVHPLPWSVGPERDHLATMLDANGDLIAALTVHLSGDSAGIVMRLLVGALNKEHATIVTQAISDEGAK